MPRFMMLMHPNVEPDASYGPPPELIEAMMRYNEELTQAGVLLALDGLMPPADGARVRFDGGRPTVTDGPFTEAKELIGGYWIIQASSQEEAVRWASRCPAQDGDMIEVRRIQQVGDDVRLSSEPPEQTSAR